MLSPPVSRGENSGSQNKEVLEQVNLLKAQISELEAQEKALDNQKAWLEENIIHFNLDPIASTYPFMPTGDKWRPAAILRLFSFGLVHLSQ